MNHIIPTVGGTITKHSRSTMCCELVDWLFCVAWKRMHQEKYNWRLYMVKLKWGWWILRHPWTCLTAPWGATAHTLRNPDVFCVNVYTLAMWRQPLPLAKLKNIFCFQVTAVAHMTWPCCIQCVFSVLHCPSTIIYTSYSPVQSIFRSQSTAMPVWWCAHLDT